MKEDRKVEYEKIFSHQSEFGTTEIFVEDNKQINEEIITGNTLVSKLFKKCIREKILFKIKTDDGRTLFNNRIVAVKSGFIQITNAFILFAEGAFPDEVNASFEDDGIDYSFRLKKYKSKGTEREILCHLPDTITVLKRRGHYRIKVRSDIPVGLYWSENDQEYIGNINDISEVGIGIKFDDCYFDYDFYNTLVKDINKNYPIILEINGDYTAVNIRIKFVSKDEDGHVLIGSEFFFTDSEQQNKINSLIDNIRQNAIFQKKKDLTIQLIKTAEMGV